MTDLTNKPRQVKSRKALDFDEENETSTRKANQEIDRLINDGYNLVTTIHTGLWKWRMIYELSR